MEVLQRRHNMRVWSGSWNPQAYVIMPITSTSLHFGWPSEVQRKCQKMCRQMEECGLMTRKKKKKKTLYFVILFCYESLLLHTLWYCFVMNHFYFILYDTVLLWITFTLYFVILFCYESLLLYTLWYCFVMNHFYFILCDTVLLWITFTSYFVILFCY